MVLSVFQSFFIHVGSFSYVYVKNSKSKVHEELSHLECVTARLLLPFREMEPPHRVHASGAEIAVLDPIPSAGLPHGWM